MIATSTTLTVMEKAGERRSNGRISHPISRWEARPGRESPSRGGSGAGVSVPWGITRVSFRSTRWVQAVGFYREYPATWSLSRAHGAEPMPDPCTRAGTTVDAESPSEAPREPGRSIRRPRSGLHRRQVSGGPIIRVASRWVIGLCPRARRLPDHQIASDHALTPGLLLQATHACGGGPPSPSAHRDTGPATPRRHHG